MRADRLLSILLLLQVHRRMKARELAVRLEVSERTIHRDMEALSTAGIPVVAERGTGGGWSLLDSYKTDLIGLSQPEIQALFLAKPSRLLADLGLRGAAEAALIKLLAAVPAVHRRDAEYVRQRIHVDTAGWQRSEDNVALLPILQAAVWQDRKLVLTYKRDDKPSAERLVDPLGLVAKGSIWYLVAAVDGAIRTYRVSRIAEARVTEEPCARPEGFELASYWEQASAAFVASLPSFPVTVRARPSILPRMPYAGRFARIARIDPPDNEGWAKVLIQFETEEEACEYVLSFGPHMEVLAPRPLREKVVELAKRTVDLYAPGAARGDV